MSEKTKAIEEYAPGPGHPNTLDGYAAWSRWRNEQESEARARRLERERLALGGAPRA